MQEPAGKKGQLSKEVKIEQFSDDDEDVTGVADAVSREVATLLVNASTIQVDSQETENRSCTTESGTVAPTIRLENILHICADEAVRPMRLRAHRTDESPAYLPPTVNVIIPSTAALVSGHYGSLKCLLQEIARDDACRLSC